MGGYERWEADRARRQARQTNLRTFAASASTITIPGVLWLQLTFGQLRQYPGASAAADAVIVGAAVLAVGLLVTPERTARLIDRSLTAVLRALLTPVAATLVAAIHAAATAAAWFGTRRRLLAERPALRPWVETGAAWRGLETWVPKPAVDPGGGGNNPALALLGMFVTRRNWLLAGAVTGLLVAAALLAAASPSSPVAPLIYTLF